MHLQRLHSFCPNLAICIYLISLSRFGPPGHTKAPGSITIFGDIEGYKQFMSSVIKDPPAGIINRVTPTPVYPFFNCITVYTEVYTT